MKAARIAILSGAFLAFAATASPTGDQYQDESTINQLNYERGDYYNQWDGADGEQAVALDAIIKLDANLDGEINIDDLRQLTDKYSNGDEDGDAPIDDEDLKLYLASRGLSKRQSNPSKRTVGAALRQQMIAYHNAYRAHHGAPAMTWSNDLALAALRSATKCLFAHTSNNPYGENIAAGTYNNPAYYAYLWYNEVGQYNFASPGFSGSTGHFTQLVWKNSAQLGCAFVGGCAGSYPYMLFCEYSPAGNVLPASNFAAQVGRPLSKPVNPTNPPTTVNNFVW